MECPGKLEMGLTEPGLWKARWIGYDSETAPLFEKRWKFLKH